MYLKQNNVADASNIPSDMSEPDNDLVCWIVIDCFLFVAIVLGNVLTILAIAITRRLRNVVSNYFILNLAVSDLLVGISLSYHVAFYLNSAMNHNELICISRFVIIGLACGGSIYNLMIISIDRYIAIVYPLSYNAYATRTRVLLIIAAAWICTIGVSSIPIYWNRFNSSSTCEFETVLPRYYVMTIQMPSFFLTWITMFLLYWKIWREAHMCARRINLSVISDIPEKNDRKSVQVVLLILGCFSICWFPYFVVICMRFSDWQSNSALTWYRATFALAIGNSGMNPLIYAWKNTNFRRAFQKILRFKSPNNKLNSSLKMYLEKQRELKNKQKDVENDYTSGNTNSRRYSSDRRSNHTEEDKMKNTTL